METFTIRKACVAADEELKHMPREQEHDADVLAGAAADHGDRTRGGVQQFHRSREWREARCS